MNENLETGLNRKEKKPIYKRGWFIVLMILLAMLLVGRFKNFMRNRPEKMGTIQWPTGEAASLLPVPQSNIGRLNYENQEGFSICIAKTSQADYNEYVTACSNKGFTVDFNKSEDSYCAWDAEGNQLILEYEQDGKKVMSISVSLKKEIESEEVETMLETETETEIETETETDCENESADQGKSKQEGTTEEDVTNSEEVAEKTENKEENGMDPDFKAAMDSYEAFMNEYIAFMVKYQESDPTDLQVLADYAEYMKKYAQVCSDFEKWEGKDLNLVETNYYIDVQTRVSKKLLEVNQ